MYTNKNLNDLKLLFLSFFIFFYTSTIAQDRPKLGLVLSGGGAKGIAEIGALKVLEEAGIRPDLITGTSIGSIVGGLYALGYPADSLIALAKSADWFDYFNDNLQRSFIPPEELIHSDRYVLSFPIENGEIKLPKGVVKGKKLDIFLSEITLPANQYKNFDEFPIPFRAIATDFETGEAFIFKGGSLKDAMRASMSIPSIFDPVLIDSTLLIDGAWVRNIPVQDAIQMGAQFTIAIDVGGPLYKKEQVSSILDVLNQSGAYGMAESNAYQSELADIVIKPAIDDFSILGFDKVDSLLAAGKLAAEQMIPIIKKQLAEIGWQSSAESIPPPALLDYKFLIKKVTMAGVNDEQKAVLLRLLSFNPTRAYALTDIEQSLKQLLGTKFVSSTDYDLEKIEGGYHLKLRLKPQKGNYINIGINYDIDQKAGLLLNIDFRNQLIPGDKLHLDLRVAEFPSLWADYMLRFSSRARLGVRLSGLIHLYPGFLYGNNKKIDEFQIHRYSWRIDAFSSTVKSMSISVGFGMERFSQNDKFFDPNTEQVKLFQFNNYLNFFRDTYNRKDFPTHGSYLGLETKLAITGRITKPFENIIRNEPVQGVAKFAFNKVFPIAEHLHFQWYNEAGVLSLEEGNILQSFFLGRELDHAQTHTYFAGLRYMEQPATSFYLSGLKFQYEPLSNIFFSLLANYGAFHLEEIKYGEGTLPTQNGQLWGAGVELGWLTLAGPLKFATEYNFGNGAVSFYLHLGHYF